MFHILAFVVGATALHRTVKSAQPAIQDLVTSIRSGPQYAEEEHPFAMQDHNNEVTNEMINRDHIVPFNFIVEDHPIIRPEQANVFDEATTLNNPLYKKIIEEHRQNDYVQQSPVEWIDDNYFGGRTYPNVTKTMLFQYSDIDGEKNHVKKWGIGIDPRFNKYPTKLGDFY